MAHYIDYYNSQIGGGRDGNYLHTGISRVYIGTPNQRGSGIGSFLGGLFRNILPLLGKGAKAVGKEAFRTGINVLSDVALRNSPVKEALRTHARESVGNLKRKAENKLDEYLMEGSGYKFKHPALSSHLLNTLGSLSTSKKSQRKKIKKSKTKKVRKSSTTSRIKKKKTLRKKKKKKTKKNRKKQAKNKFLEDIFSQR